MNNLKIARAFRALDYGVGVATVGYGLFTLQPLFIGFGVAGLVLAHLNLSERMAQGLRRYFGRKTGAIPAAPSSFDQGDITQAQAHLPSPTRTYAEQGLSVQAGLASTSRHSVLRHIAHLNHAHKP